MTKRCIIWDIDGTLAKIDHRLHWIQGMQDPVTGEYKKAKKNWKMFHLDADKDEPIEPTVFILEMLLKSSYSYDYPQYPDLEILFVSGRGEENKSITEKWLAKHIGNITIREKLYMRKRNDFRDDTIVKKEILDQIRAEGYEVIGAFDDRKRVVDMWRENGVFCFDVNQSGKNY